MKKQPKTALPKKRSPIPPPGRIIDDRSYNRRKAKRELNKAIATFEAQDVSPAVRLVVFDLDGTLWTVREGCHSLMSPPLRKAGADTVADSSGNTLKLVDGALQVLEWLRGHGIFVSIASRGDRKIALEVLRILKITESLTCPHILKERKIFLIRAIRDEIYDRYDIALRPDQILLVDDSESNISDAQSMGLRTAQVGCDIQSVAELPSFLADLR